MRVYYIHALLKTNRDLNKRYEEYTMTGADFNWNNLNAYCSMHSMTIISKAKTKKKEVESFDFKIHTNRPYHRT